MSWNFFSKQIWRIFQSWYHFQTGHGCALLGSWWPALHICYRATVGGPSGTHTLESLNSKSFGDDSNGVAICCHFSTYKTSDMTMTILHILGFADPMLLFYRLLVLHSSTHWVQYSRFNILKQFVVDLCFQFGCSPFLRLPGESVVSKEAFLPEQPAMWSLEVGPWS